MILLVAVVEDFKANKDAPACGTGIESRLDQWVDTGRLPGYRIADNPETVERWMKAIGKLPD